MQSRRHRKRRKYDKVTLPALNNPSPEEIVHRIQEAGIVGMGGATFPTHVKLSPKTHVDTLIINAAECEPYITCDYRLLLEKTDEFIAGVLLLKKALGAEHVFIGIEKNKPEAIKKLIADCVNTDIAVAPCKVKYPQARKTADLRRDEKKSSLRRTSRGRRRRRIERSYGLFGGARRL